MIIGAGGYPTMNIDIILPIPPRYAQSHITRNNKVRFSIDGIIQSRVRPIPNPRPPKKTKITVKDRTVGNINCAVYGTVNAKNQAHTGQQYC